MKNLLYIALILGLFSCEKQLNISLDEFEKKLVVNSSIAPGLPMVFYLGESAQILDEPVFQAGIYEGRLIVLEDSIVIYDQLSAIDSGFLYTPLVPHLNSHYEIYFDIEGFPLISSSDLVPMLEPDFDILSVIPLSDKFQVQINVQDHPQEENYQIQAFVAGKEFIGNDTFWTEKAVNFSSSDRVFLTNIISFRSNNSFALFADNLFSGSNRTITLNLSKSNFDPDNFIPEEVIIQISSLSDTYFNYILEIIENNHIYGGPLSSSSYDAGNIEGGLGIFGAYSFKKLSFSL